jgi:hypothetical protein
MAEAFYTRQGAHYVPTPYCIGPWSPATQHGGPPAALLGGAAEAHGQDAGDFSVVRVTVELLRPVPLAPLSVQVEPIRLGRQVQWFSATLRSDGKVLARASVVRIRTEAQTLPASVERPRPAPRPPGESEPYTFDFFPVEVAYHTAVEMRCAAGTWGSGPATAWLRPRVPLVEGQETTPLERTLVLADATNGVAPVLSPDDFVFINPDLTVYLQRSVASPWLALEARSVPSADGIGLVQSVIYDERGEVGRCLQALVIRPRS